MHLVVEPQQLRRVAHPAPAAAFHVGLYDGQGQLRWEGSTRTGQLRLDSRRLPRGLYGVVITKEGVVSRHHLSLQ